jgi:ribosome biogenesis GTPase
MGERLSSYGWNDRWVARFTPHADDGRQPGRVLRQDLSASLVATRQGVVHVPARRTVPPLAVGDWVVIENSEVIVAVLERSSVLRRRDPEGGEQLLAANIDVVAMVFGADRPLKAGRLFRTTTQIWDAGAVPVVVLTKTDLLLDVDAAVDRVHEIDPNTDVVAVSSVRGDGIEALRRRISGLTVVLVGESGAGKSTLVNALHGDEVAAVSGVRGTDHRGRHTTTSRELHLLPGGGVLIDTPGLREVGLWTDESAVDETFPEIAALADDCQFRDCSHGPEPGCAVRAAVADGRLTEERFMAWESLRREAVSARLRADEHARRAEDRRFGRMVKDAVRDKRRR